MKKKRKHADIEKFVSYDETDLTKVENKDNIVNHIDLVPDNQLVQQDDDEQEQPEHQQSDEQFNSDKINQSSYNHHNNPKKQKRTKQVYTRVSVDPTRQYRTPESRESWGPNVKGKKFRKEKGKKKRCPNAGVRIDGSVKSVRLDS